MDTLLCHSGMVIGSFLGLGFVTASLGGLGLLVAAGLRRTIRPPATS